MSSLTKDELDNRSDQLNPNNDAFWLSRGFEGRPDDSEDESTDDDDEDDDHVIDYSDYYGDN